MRAVVCGAGIAGLATTRLLADEGWDVDLVERAPSLRSGGYMMDFFGPGYEAAEAMGLLPRLRAKAYAVDEVTYVDRRGRTTARLDYTRMRAALDGRLISLLRGDLEEVLHEGLDARRVTHRFGATIDDVAAGPGEVRVTLSDGTALAVDLLVGADGIHSRVRQLVFGPDESFLHFLGLHTAAYLVDDRHLHARLAGRFLLTDTIDHAVGLYGLRDARVAVFAVHRAAEPTTPADPRKTLRRRYRDLGPVVARVLEQCPASPDLYYDQVAQVRMPAWVTGRTVLVGDACQAVSLLAGQGASLAVAGAHVLGTELGAGPTVPAALERYQERMRPVVLGSQEAGRRTAEWFLPTSRRRLWLRRLALLAMRVPGPDRLLASGLVGNAGRVP